MYKYYRPEDDKQSGFTGYMVNEESLINSFNHHEIHRTKEFREAMSYFDKNDTMTRSILLSVNEADQNGIMLSLSNKLYQNIVDRVDEIDFGTIPQSGGDITKIENYSKLCDCVNIITEILQQYHQPTKAIDTVSDAIQNIQDRSDLFTLAYKVNVEMPIIIYNSIVLAIVSSVSYMISSCIEFVKLPDNQGFDIALNKASAKNTQNHLLFQNLEKFNKLCATHEFDKAMEFIMNGNSKKFIGSSGAFTISVVLGILLLIIPVIRELIFFFYYSRAKISDYFDAQASLLLINSYNIENNLSPDETDKIEIAKKQKAIADKFKSISNFFAIKSKSAEKQTKDEINKLNSKKYKSSEVIDSIPDSANSVLF